MKSWRKYWLHFNKIHFIMFRVEMESRFSFRCKLLECRVLIVTRLYSPPSLSPGLCSKDPHRMKALGIEMVGRTAHSFLLQCIYLFISLSISVSVGLSVCLIIYLYFWAVSVFLSVCLFISLSIRVFAVRVSYRLAFCLCMCISVIESLCAFSLIVFLYFY